ENDQDKQAAYATLYHCLVTLAKLLAPFTPFLAEALYQNLVRPAYPESPESIHLTDFPVADPSQIDRRLAEDTRLAMKIASLGRAARSQAGIKVRQPLARVLVKVPSQIERKALKALAPQVMEELNVKGLEPLEDEAQVMSYEVKPNLPLLGPKYGKELGRIAKALTSLPPQEVAAKVQGGRKVEAGGYSLEPQEVLVTAKAAPGYEVAQEGGYLVAVDTRIAPELKDEGTAREIVHRLQTMRRSAGFDIADYITTYYQAGPALKKVMEQFGAYIRQETLSRSLVEGPPPDGAYQETHRLEGQEITLGVKRLG
ncbi:MAG: DUF5915 domain-containing protein, partial [Chloroflexota bacterium]|nr:DUF5915 domain-containing protein [Chloroflexota bacterium]